MVSTSLPSETLIFTTTHSFSSLLSISSFSHRVTHSLTPSFSTDSHRVRFLPESSLDSTMSSPSTAAVSGEFMLFGVRVVVDSMRKSVSMNNLSQYEQPQDNISIKDDNNKDALAVGYASADDAVPNNSGRNRDRERKRGIPWTEEEHKLFLVGLQKVGKGDWRGISRNYVKTRTPTQVASHAQKYFLRRSNLNRRRRRSSLFDITTDSVSAIPMEEEQVKNQESVSQVQSMCPAAPETRKSNGFPFMSVYQLGVDESPMEELTLGQGNVKQNFTTNLFHPIPFVVSDPKPSTASDITSSSSSSIEPPTLSLGLSFSSSDQRKTSSTHATLRAMPCFNNGDNIISVA